MQKQTTSLLKKTRKPFCLIYVIWDSAILSVVSYTGKSQAGKGASRSYVIQDRSWHEREYIQGGKVSTSSMRPEARSRRISQRRPPLRRFYQGSVSLLVLAAVSDC